MSEILCNGKSKYVYSTTNPNEVIIQFKDQALACNGLKRGKIEGKGRVNTAVTQSLYRVLEDRGIKTHFIKSLDDTSILVKKVEMIPLIIKVRNRAAGSLATRLGLPVGTKFDSPIVEICLRDEVLEDPIINLTHIKALNLAKVEEVEFMLSQALKINTLLSGFLNKERISLVDLKIEFGRYNGEILLADDISTDNTRFWDAETDEPMDMDRFRWGLGDIEEKYRELVDRLVKAE